MELSRRGGSLQQAAFAAHFSQTSALSTRDSQCRLWGSQLRLLEFRFVVESGVGPDADNRK
jgi:hypothetical protein